MDQPASKEGPDLSWRGKGIVCGVTTKKDPVIELVRLAYFRFLFHEISFHSMARARLNQPRSIAANGAGKRLNRREVFWVNYNLS